jgi:dephospho-CoA kinase
MIKKIGITGPSGSGKSLLCERLKKENIVCIDADALYHSMLIPPSRCLNAIADVFGEDIISSDGTLDRGILAAKVFSDASSLQKLNDTVLPIVISEIRNIISRLEAEGHTLVVIDAPTLIESNFHKECEKLTNRFDRLFFITTIAFF